MKRKVRRCRLPTTVFWAHTLLRRKAPLSDYFWTSFCRGTFYGVGGAAIASLDEERNQSAEAAPSRPYQSRGTQSQPCDPNIQTHWSSRPQKVDIFQDFLYIFNGNMNGFCQLKLCFFRMKNTDHTFIHYQAERPHVHVSGLGGLCKADVNRRDSCQSLIGLLTAVATRCLRPPLHLQITKRHLKPKPKKSRIC